MISNLTCPLADSSVCADNSTDIVDADQALASKDHHTKQPPWRHRFVPYGTANVAFIGI